MLIAGEPGTGKEGLAHTIHELMHPDGGPLVSIATGGRSDDDLAPSCSAPLPRGKGERSASGAVELAEGGTLVIDDIAWLSPNLQWRLLDLLRRGAYTRGGETRVRHAQLHVIAITDEDLPKSIAAGRFRHDLYHKLARIHLVLPPLRQRPEDIPAAVEWMANRVLMLRGQSSNVELESAERDRPDAVIISDTRPSTRCAPTTGPATSASWRWSSSARSCSTATASRSPAPTCMQALANPAASE